MTHEAEGERDLLDVSIGTFNEGMDGSCVKGLATTLKVQSISQSLALLRSRSWFASANTK